MDHWDLISLFQINFNTDATFDVEASNLEDAIDMASDLLYDSLVGEYEWDCNEVIDLG